MNCPFCQASVRDAVFAESPYCLAICNIAPILPGHSMVIPKRHVARLNDLTNEEYNDLMNFMRTVSNGLMRAFAATGIDWTLQDGEDAGQTIPHLHFHLIPRRAHDLPQPGDWFPKLRKSQLIDSDQRPRLSSEEIHQAVEKLRPYF